MVFLTPNFLLVQKMCLKSFWSRKVVVLNLIFLTSTSSYFPGREEIHLVVNFEGGGKLLSR